MSELKLCPFCGKEAVARSVFDYWKITCCGCGVVTQGASYGQALDRWNLRHSAMVDSVLVSEPPKFRVEIIPSGNQWYRGKVILSWIEDIDVEGNALKKVGNYSGYGKEDKKSCVATEGESDVDCI